MRGGKEGQGKSTTPVAAAIGIAVPAVRARSWFRGASLSTLARTLLVAWLGMGAQQALAQSATCTATDEQLVNYDFSATTWTAGDTSDSVTAYNPPGTVLDVTLDTTVTGGNTSEAPRKSVRAADRPDP